MAYLLSASWHLDILMFGYGPPSNFIFTEDEDNEVLKTIKLDDFNVSTAVEPMTETQNSESVEQYQDDAVSIMIINCNKPKRQTNKKQ